jgi:hypothetical protein
MSDATLPVDQLARQLRGNLPPIEWPAFRAAPINGSVHDAIAIAAEQSSFSRLRSQPAEAAAPIETW